MLADQYCESNRPGPTRLPPPVPPEVAVGGSSREQVADVPLAEGDGAVPDSPLRVGAIVGSGGAADVRDMVRFGFHLGAAFQIRDDLLNLTATRRSTARRSTGTSTRGSARWR